MDFSLELLALIVTAATSVFKSISFVHEGELGIRLRFGKALREKNGNPRIITPGFVFMIPFVDTLRRHHVRQQTIRMANQKVMIKHGLIFNVSAVVILRVQDIYKAMFEIDDLDNSLVDLSMGILRDVLADKDHFALSDMETISSELLRRLQGKADEWGVVFSQFNLTDCAPTTETAPLINAEAGVAMKMQALKKAAEEMGIEFDDLSPVLAAALVGVPLVTSITNNVRVTEKAKANGSALSAVFSE